MRDLTDEESKIYNNRLESEAVDTAIRILDSIRPSCGSKLTFIEEEVYTALSMGISAIKELEKAKGLLKSAVEDVNSNNFCHKFDTCKVCAKKYSISCDKKFKWRYTDVVLKLIGDELNGV